MLVWPGPRTKNFVLGNEILLFYIMCGLSFFLLKIFFFSWKHYPWTWRYANYYCCKQRIHSISGFLYNFLFWIQFSLKKFYVFYDFIKKNLDSTFSLFRRSKVTAKLLKIFQIFATFTTNAVYRSQEQGYLTEMQDEV